MNWVDWLLIAFVLISVASGFAAGFIRLVIGFAALILGFLFASWFHGLAAGWIMPYLSSKAAANFLGFIMILAGVLAIGALVATVIQRMFKLVGLSWLDRVAGGAFGVVRGVVVLAVGALLISTFFPRSLPGAVSRSELAPYVFGVSKVLSEITPYDIKNGFEHSYQEFTTVLEGLKKNKP